MRAHGAHLLAIVVVAGLVYANTFDVPFTFDDDQHLLEGPAGSRSPVAALAGCATQNRCVGFFSFALNFLAGGLEVRGYHAANLLVHALAGLLVYLLGVLLAKTPRMQGVTTDRQARAVAMGAALLFVVHPLQTMAVTYVVQRFASLAALFYLGAAVAWLGARLEGRRRALLLALSLGSAVLAMKTKENAVTLPLALALLELTFFAGPAWPRLARLLPWALPVALPLLSSFVGPANADTDAALRGPGQSLEYASTQATVIPRYLRLLLWPVGQSVDHHPPRFATPWQAAPLGGGALVFGLLWLGAWFAWRPPGGRRALVPIGFGVLWFFLALAVESSVLPIRDVMVEHRLYLPLAGLSLSVAVAVALGVERARWAALPAAATLAALAWASHARNEVWRDEPRLWREAMALAPAAWRPPANLGQALLERGRCSEAVPYLEAARALDASQLLPLLNLGVCEAALGARARATARFEEALALAPDDGRAPAQLASLASEEGELGAARTLYERALALRPGDGEVRAGLGATLGQLGLLVDARAHLERAAIELPCSAMAWGNLGNVRQLQGDAAGAEQAWRHALKCDPSDAAARANLERRAPP